jgi:hypothetical protein
MKANYAAKGGKLMLRYESGAFAVVTKNDKKEANDKADAIFIQLLAQCSCENAIVTTGNKSTYYAPKILARMNGRGPFSFAKGRDRGSACADGMRWPNRLGRSRQSMGWRGAAKA